MTVAKAPDLFVRILCQAPVSCPRSSCACPVTVDELSTSRDRVKSFLLRCETCGWEARVSGVEQIDPPWNELSLMEIVEEHLLPLEPVCPYDHVSVQFQSLPNPRRRARYRISCSYCGRQTEIDWPPEESKW